MNPQTTRMESCGWKNVAIYPGLIRQVSVDSLDRGWMIPFGIGFFAPESTWIVANSDEAAEVHLAS